MSRYRPPPPPPPDFRPPLPPEPPPSNSHYRFGSRQEEEDYRRHDFTYRDRGAPEYPQQADHYSPRRREDERPRRNRDVKSNDRQRQRSQQQQQRNKFQTSSRQILHLHSREKTPEQLLGMHATNEHQRFLNMDDLSDSEEEEMEIESLSNDEEAEYEPEPARKRQATEKASTTTVDETPKWSNPDPYTVLPPVSDSNRKRKDVVKLIRKAKVTVSASQAEDQVAENDDFISLNFDDGLEITQSAGKGVPGAPSGPAASRFSHRRELNGVATLDELPPPPHNLPEKPKMFPSLPVTDDSAATSDAALGRKKRKYDDLTDDIPEDMLPTKGKKRGKIDGSIIKAWQLREGCDPVPWCTEDHSKTKNIGFWLHKEICDFYHYVRPRDYENILRSELLDRLNVICRKHDQSSTVKCFGSFAAGLYLPDADMDVVLLSKEYEDGGFPRLGQSKNQMRHVARLLEKEIAAAGSMETIFGAKVPLLKFVDRVTGLKVDLSFENDSGIIALTTFRHWKEKYPAMPIIVMILKHFLAMRNLNEVKDGGMGGFSVTCLVVSLFQHMPQLQSRNMSAEHHLGDVLMEFLDLYGNQFNYVDVGIRLEPAGYFPKAQALPGKKKERLTIMDPNRPENDISVGTSNIQLIFKLFSLAYDTLQKRMSEQYYATIAERKGVSLLSPLLEGNYERFDWQRSRLRNLYDDKLDGQSSLR